LGWQTDALEEKRDRAILQNTLKIQRTWRKYKNRRYFEKIRKAAIVLQSGKTEVEKFVG
jgi:myosin heavy subunit